MLARAGAAAFVLAVLVAGCGGAGDSRRDVVADYITQVNAVEAKLRAPVTAASKASRSLSAKNADLAAAAPRLRTAASRIDRLRGKLAAIAAPPEARRLRALLLEQSAGEAAIAREVGELAAFLPAYATALRPLERARSDLRQTLAEKGRVRAKADSLDAYSTAIGETLIRLKPLEPPPVAAPEYRTQVATLTRIRGASTELARALRKRRADDLPKLVQRFEEASLGSQSLGAQRAQIGAVRAYNARVRDLETLLLRIDRERSRLEKRLG